MLPAMADPQNLRNVIWLAVSVVEVLFLVYLLLKRVYRSHPFFFLYALSLVIQTVAVAFVYRRWGSTSPEYQYVAWFSQGLIVGMRWLAVAEIARKILAKYVGVWRLANFVLFVLGLIVLTYALVLSDLRLYAIVMSADRGVEMCVAVFVVGMFAFAYYYRLPILDLERQLAIGFGLYSCVWVVNDTIYLAWRQWLGPIWDFILTIAFLASVALWFVAFRTPLPTTASAPEPEISPEIYARLSEEVNSRLLTLNTRLNRLLGPSEDSRP